MDEANKKALIKILLTEGVPFILKTFLSGKTKLGVYILGLTWASAKFFLDVDLPAGVDLPAEAVGAALPVPVKVGAGVGTAVLGVGLVHDLLKKGKLSLGKVFSIFKK